MYSHIEVTQHTHVGHICTHIEVTQHTYAWTHIKVIDELVDNAARPGATEADDDSLCLFEHERHVPHHIGEAHQVVDGDSNVVCPRA